MSDVKTSKLSPLLFSRIIGNSENVENCLSHTVLWIASSDSEYRVPSLRFSLTSNLHFLDRTCTSVILGTPPLHGRRLKWKSGALGSLLRSFNSGYERLTRWLLNLPQAFEWEEKGDRATVGSRASSGSSFTKAILAWDQAPQWRKIKAVSQWYGHPRVLGIPIPISLAFWASPVGDAQNADRFDFA